MGTTLFIAVVTLGTLLLFFVVLTIICLIRDARHRGQRQMLGGMLYHAQQEVVYHRSQIQIAQREAEIRQENEAQRGESLVPFRPLGVRNSFRSDNPFIRKDSTSPEVRMFFTNLNLEKLCKKIIAKNILSCAICGANIAVSNKNNLSCAIYAKYICKCLLFLDASAGSGFKSWLWSFLSLNIPDFSFFTGTSIKAGTDHPTGGAGN